MVWSVCRQLLADPADAEDAFQATFLALVRSGRTIRSGAAVGGWLHGVAVRSAAALKRSAVRRRQREQRAAATEAERPVPDSSWNALLAAVHEEVRQLPDPLRTAFVLCDLEGVPQPDAAIRLGWKPGTLTGRLARARHLLLERLTGRGLAPAVAAGGLVTGAANAAVPGRLMDTALSLTAGAAPSAILKLVREVAPMTLNRAKLFAAAVVVAGGLAAGVVPALLSNAGAQPGAGGSGGKGLGGAGGGQPGGAGGAPGLPPGGGGPGGMMSGFPSGHWEYRFVDLKNDDRDAFEKTIRQSGGEGWEYCGSERLRKGNDPVNLVLVFKRPSGPRGFGSGMSGGDPMPGGSPMPGGGRPGQGGPGGGLGGNPLGGRVGGGSPTGGADGGPPKGGEARFNIFHLKNANATETAVLLQKLFSRDVIITADQRTNTVVARADEPTLDMLRALIARLDSIEIQEPPKKR